MLLGDIIRQNAMKFPNKTALVFKDSRFTYSELNNRVNRLANALLGIGMKQGDRVAILADSCHQYMELYFAAAKGGMIVAPVNTALDSDGLVYTINDSGANTIIFSEKYLETVNSIRCGLKTAKNYIVIGKAAGVESYEGLVSKYPPDEPEVAIDEDDIAWFFYTSGTTGPPKGVMLSHKNLISTMVNLMLSGYHIKRSDVHLIYLPLFFGVIQVVFCHFYIGSTIIILERFEPQLVLETIERERITTNVAVPTMVVPLVDYPYIDKYDVSSMRIIICGGAPMTERLEKRMNEIFGDIVLQVYGLTEEAFFALATPLMEVRWIKVKRPGSCGKEITGVEVRLVNEEGGDVAPGEVGEMLVRGDNVMKGYWNMPEATAKALEGGWLHTDDLAIKGEEGYYYITGRKKDTIISAGRAIYSPEIESVISLHPSISEVVVIGVPDEELGGAVKAVVVLKPREKATEQEIIKWCASQLEDYKVPQSVDIVDSLPKTPSGKVRKTALIDKYTGG